MAQTKSPKAIGFPLVSYSFPLIFEWFSNGFPMTSDCSPMVFLWLSYGFPMGLLWIFWCFHVVMLMFSNGFPNDFRMDSHGFPVAFTWTSFGFPMDFHRFELPGPEVSIDFNWNQRNYFHWFLLKYQCFALEFYWFSLISIEILMLCIGIPLIFIDFQRFSGSREDLLVSWRNLRLVIQSSIRKLACE